MSGPSSARGGRPGLRHPGYRGAREHSHHQVLRGLVAHPAPALHLQADGKAGHAAEHVDPPGDFDFWYLLPSGLRGVGSSTNAAAS